MLSALNMIKDEESRRMLSLALNTISLIAIYTIYGVLQERIMKGEYEVPAPDGSTASYSFTSSPLLVLCNRLTSLFTGILLVLRKPTTSYSPLPSNSSREHNALATKFFSYLDKLRPASPLYCYAIISIFNNAATSAQYTSLSYLSFTTTTLGKSAKMIPALIIGSLLYKKQYKQREWVGVALVIAGIYGYLRSQPKYDLDETESQKVLKDNWTGAACLIIYLFFDGLTSTTQEWLFDKGKNGNDSSKNAGEPAPTFLGLTEAVMDQMIWVNLFSSIVAFAMLLMSPAESTQISLYLARHSSALQFHILLLSLTATCGLLVLFYVIATYGALISGLIMTLRQFVSVVFNAVWFGNMGDIPSTGWACIGIFAAGVWIKIDRRYDAPVLDVGNRKPSQPLSHGPGNEKDANISKSAISHGPKLLRQYLLPLGLCPLIFVLLYSIFTFISGLSDETQATELIDIQYDPVKTVETSETRATPAAAVPTFVPFRYFEHTPDFLKSESGNLWDEKLIDMLNPDCPTGPINAVQYNTSLRTALATFPRSGSTYTRTLIERATGYLTTSIYCDGGFSDFFLGECDFASKFLQKTHYPAAVKHQGESDQNWFKHYDRYLQIVRNPIDVIWSAQNMMMTKDQSARIDKKFTLEDHADLQFWLDEWNGFLNYWDATPIPGHVIRYEDFRRNPFVKIMDIISFLLPEELYPPLARVACALQLDPEKEMYPSSKIQPFDKWEEHFDRETFDWMIEQVAENWCKYGYDQLLQETQGRSGPVSCVSLRKGVSRQKMMNGTDWEAR